MNHFLEWIAGVSCFGLFIYKWLIIIAIVMTWVSADPRNQIVKFVSRITTPLWVWCENRLPVMLSHFSAYASILLVIFVQVRIEIRNLFVLLKMYLIYGHLKERVFIGDCIMY